MALANSDEHTNDASVKMFYTSSKAALGAYVSPSNLPKTDQFATNPTSIKLDDKKLHRPGGSNPLVNEIIVKVEMKKFQNLIENRIKHKNNLL